MASPRSVDDLVKQRDSTASTPIERIRQNEAALLQRHAEFLERGFDRLTDSISNMVHSKYTKLNTTYFACSFLTAIFLMLLLSNAANSNLPKAVDENDKSSVDAGRFIGSRAVENLKYLSKIGPKVVGSYENEYLTVNYLKTELEKIKQRTPVEWNGIDVDIQVVNGSFIAVPSGVENFPILTTYQNVQNVVAKLYSKHNATESILVNCHFDSFFSTPGTSGGSLNCAVMLEVLRVMSKIDHPLQRNVIFLFNGAVEDGVSGSHGFITQHKWIDDIVCFVNLQSAGAGGRQLLIETGPNSYILPKIYSKSVPYPSGKVLNEELPLSGLFPSGSDFNNFHHYSKQKLKGLNFAHLDNGYSYHTVNDNISVASEDVMQLTGDNLQALLQALIQYTHLKEDLNEDNDRAVYYDIFGFFQICYSSLASFFVNVGVAFISIYSSLIMMRRVFKGKPINESL